MMAADESAVAREIDGETLVRGVVKHIGFDSFIDHVGIVDS